MRIHYERHFRALTAWISHPWLRGHLRWHGENADFRSRSTCTSYPEGTLRFLWLTTLLQSPGLTALSLLDEPEVSLHPELLSLLADQLRKASLRTQLIVATHSDTLIRFLEPPEVVVLDATEDGMTTLTRADELDLGEWLKGYSLDELWRNGRQEARA